MPRRTPTILLLLFMSIVLVGCGSRPALTRECDVPELASLLEERRLLVAKSLSVPTIRDGRTIRVAVRFVPSTRATGAEPSRTVVLVHGMMADHRAFRFLEPQLARDFDVLLVDLPGFGSSEAPTGSRFADSDFSTDALADRVLQAIEGVLDLEGRWGAPATGGTEDGRDGGNGRLGRSIALVGHSLGGAVVLRGMCDPQVRARHARVLDRVDRLVLMAPVDVAVPNPPRPVVRFLETSELMFSLGSVSGELRRDIERETALQAGDDCAALAEEAQTRIDYLDDPARRRIMRSIFLQLSPLTPDRRPDWAKVAQRESDYARLDDHGQIPALLLWGRFDEFTPVASGYKLAMQLPGATLRVMEGVKHSPHIERPAETARILADFLNPPPEPAAPPTPEPGTDSNNPKQATESQGTPSAR